MWEDPDDGVDSNCDGYDANTLGGAWAWLNGEDDFDGAGVAACPLPDIDGDGDPELVIGAPYSDAAGPSSGRVYVVDGGALSPGMDLGIVATARITGEQVGDELGWSVATGDFDGDGRGDLVTGGWRNDGSGENAGAVYVFWGATLAAGGDIAAGDADVILRGEAAYDLLGWGLANVGDVDGDGTDDLALSAYKANIVSASGDALWDAGRLHLFLGGSLPASGVVDLNSADVVIDGSDLYANMGGVIDGGDLDDDGLSDVVLSGANAEPAGVGSGRAYVLDGSTLTTAPPLTAAGADLVVDGVAPGDNAGRFVKIVDDLDGDGRDELAVGAMYYDGPGVNRGAVGIFYGAGLAPGQAHLLTDADVLIVGAVDHQNIGGSIASADLDGDGAADLLIGSAQDPIPGVSTGAVYGFLGPTVATATSSLDADVILRGEAAGDNASRYLCDSTDFDGDGRDELVVPARGRSDTLSAQGRVYVLQSPW